MHVVAAQIPAGPRHGHKSHAARKSVRYRDVSVRWPGGIGVGYGYRISALLAQYQTGRVVQGDSQDRAGMISSDLVEIAGQRRVVTRVSKKYCARPTIRPGHAK
jgi:hypothetical protein